MSKTPSKDSAKRRREVLDRIRRLIFDGTGGRGIALLTTAGNDKDPHATWMGTVASPSLDRIVTMTSPDSRKARNVLENSRVEWLFTGGDMDELVYLRGHALVLEDMKRIEEAWNQMPDKSRAYFLPFQTCGIKFLIIETKIESIEYRIPCDEHYYHFAKKDIAKAVAATSK